MNTSNVSFSQSLTGRLFKLVFGGYVILAIAVTVIQLALEYSSVQQTIAEDLSSIGQSFNGGVTGAMWEMDRSLLRTIAQGIAQSSIVTGVKVSSLNGEVFAAIGEIPSAKLTEPNNFLSRTQFHTSYLQKETFTGMRKLGELTVYSNRHIAIDRVTYSFIVILINSLIKTTGLWVIFYLVLSRYLARPLSKLTTIVSQLEFVAESKDPILLNFSKRLYSKQDELGRLIGAVDKMQQRLFKTHGALKLINSDLEEKVTERTKNLADALAFNETILYSSPIPVGVYTTTGRCVLANGAFAEFMGLKQKDLIALNFYNIDLWEKSSLLEDCEAALIDGNPKKYETSALVSTGKVVWFEYHIIPTLLKGSIHLLIQFFDLTVHKEMEEKLRYFATHDSLTQLPNRRLLLDRISHAMSNGNRHNTYSAILFIDMNNFKLINDTHGHEIGDMLLCEVAERLLRVMRENDTVARLGGDEFIVLLEECHSDPDLAAQYIDVVVRKVSNTLSDEYILKEISHFSSASIGTKMFLGDNQDPMQILKQADADMYENKK